MQNYNLTATSKMCTSVNAYACSLWNEKSGKLRKPSFMKTGMPFAFVAAVGGVGFEDVAVAGFEFFQDAAFVDHAGAAVVGECAEKNGILAVLGVEGAELGEVFAE